MPPKTLRNCVVGGCPSTSRTNRMFNIPRNDELRKLWMSLLCPTNHNLLLLDKNQLIHRYVCDKHFETFQIDKTGKRQLDAYPSLFTEQEMQLGMPHNVQEYHVLHEHNYVKETILGESNVLGPPVVLSNVTGLVSQEHLYCAQSISNLNASVDHDVIPIIDSRPSSSVDKQLKSTKMISKTNEKRQPACRARRKFAITNLGGTSLQTIKKSQKIFENSKLFNNFDKLNNKAKTFLLMQLKFARKNKLSRRFSLQEKLLALALMKQSPKGYKLLETIFALPNKRTLSRLSTNISLECGMNEKIFKHISSTTKNWDMKKRLCTVLFDEVSLTPHLTYNENREYINGFVEIAGERKPKIADHALVFMVRGICAPWRQTIAYYFCEGTVSAAELQRILKELIPKLKSSGLNPLGLVCDQGSTFRSCFKALREETIRFRSNNNMNDDGTIHIDGINLFMFHDAPHLIKAIRNNFLEKDIIFKGKQASWKDIEYVYDLDCKLGHTRALPKLTAQHVERTQIKKMKVKTAVQVLSARTAAMLAYTKAIHERLNVSHETMGTTAAVVEFFDDLFDSVNGSPGGVKGKLRNAVKKHSPHVEFWTQALNILKGMKFIDTKSKLARQAGQPRHVRVPSLEGWNTTLQSFIGLSNMLFYKYDVDFFYPRFINQDPLENFFGRIRAMNYSVEDTMMTRGEGGAGRGAPTPPPAPPATRRLVTPAHGRTSNFISPLDYSTL